MNPPHLPSDRPRALVTDKRWARAVIDVEPDLMLRARELAGELAIALEEVLLAVWQMLLARWSAQDEITVVLRRREYDGAGGESERTPRDESRLVEVDLSAPLTFMQVLSQVHAAVSRAVARGSRQERGFPGSPATFELIDEGGAAGIVAIDVGEECGNRSGDLELGFVLRSSAGRTTAVLVFRADLLEPQTAEAMLRYYRRLLSLALAAPRTAIAALPLVTDDERVSLLERSNASACAFAETRHMHQRFEARVCEHPDRVALICRGEAMTYRALNQHANRLARHLRGLGVGPDVIVAICLERSEWMMIAMLGVQKAGGAFLPLDQALPPARLEFALVDSSAAVVLTDTTQLALLPQAISKLCLDSEWDSIAQCDAEDLEPLGDPEHLAYVIYTSGSSGRPKGVMIPRGAAQNFMSSMEREPGLSAEDRLLATTTFAFDAALFELMLPLMVGATLVLASSEERVDPWRLCEMLDDFAITIVTATPTTWSQLLGVGWKRRGRFRALVGGEALAHELARDLLARCSEVWNMYGPTEAAVAATCWRVSDPERGIFIGKPIANTRCLVLDRDSQLAPIGGYGELCIGGAGLARGYVNASDLTRARFVSDPYRPGDRLYRTGDLVRWHPSGFLEFAGRIDHQVKLRGLRIELGEIEALLAACDGVLGSAVIVREDRPGDRRLVAYVVGRVPDVGALRKLLARNLPAYMMPSAIVELDAFPLTPNRKIDLKALPAPVPSTQAAMLSAPSAAMDSLQRSLAVEWEEALGIRPVGLDDDFFDLGGHSLLALSLLSRVAARFGHRLTPASFLAAPTVRAQAELLRNGLFALGVRSVVPIHAAGTRSPLFFASGWGGPTLSLRALADALGSEQPLYLLDYVGTEETDGHTLTIEGIASALIAEMRRLQPRGPYQLVGYSLGARIVYAMAQHLRKAGESVPVLILLDDYAPGHPILPPFFMRAFLHVKQALKLGPLRMWPYLLKYVIRLRRLLIDVKPKLYTELTDKAASPLADELNRGALTIYRASKKYRVERLPGRMMVITADDISECGIGAFDRDPTFGWREWADEAFSVGSLPCTHSSMLDPQHASKLAAMIDECLELGTKRLVLDSSESFAGLTHA